MSSDPIHDVAAVRPTAIAVSDLTKCYQIYAKPHDRLRQALFPRVRRTLGFAPARYYSEFWALRDIDFQIGKGETVAIIGKNGSGKSTLLQILCGTLTPTSGEIAVEGRVAALLELGSGFNPEYTGRENVYLNGSVLGLTQQQVDDRFQAIEAFADIGEFINQPVKTYSSGMYVRLAFAVIANVDADVLIVDEALSVGDVYFGQKCMRFLREFQSRGTLIFVSHDSAAVVNLCERAIWLDHGRVVMDGPASEVSRAYHAKSYGMDVQVSAPQENELESAVASLPQLEFEVDRSVMRVFRFSAPNVTFGDGRAKITSVALVGGTGVALSRVEGGESVTLRVDAQVHAALTSPIVGFFLKDRLGQQLFGTNTFLGSHCVRSSALPGQRVRAEFSFRIPHLPPGKYTVDVALADGTQEEHVQNDWAFDALAIESVSSSLAVGIIGIPYHAVSLKVADGDSSA